MKQLNVFSKKVGVPVFVGAASVGSKVRNENIRFAASWSDGGWSNYSDSWLNSGWNNYSSGWTNSGWSNSGGK